MFARTGISRLFGRTTPRAARCRGTSRRQAGRSGPTPTLALLPGSPALNAGDPDQTGSLDQRGVPRTGGVNIGAFQASAARFVVTAYGSATAGVPLAFTVLVVDSFGQAAAGYTGSIRFLITDPDSRARVDPPFYTFQARDGGSFLGGVTFFTRGHQSLVVDDRDSGISGFAVVTVT